MLVTIRLLALKRLKRGVSRYYRDRCLDQCNNYWENRLIHVSGRHQNIQTCAHTTYFNKESLQDVRWSPFLRHCPTLYIWLSSLPLAARLSFFFPPPPARATFSRRRCRRSVWIFFSFPKGWAAAGRGSDAAPLREKREQRRFSVLTFSSGRIIVNNCLESPTNWAKHSRCFRYLFFCCV